jgi:hypothetical protein
VNEAGEQERLLNDIVAESAPGGLREALLERTLRQVKRRRHARQARRTVGVLVLVLGLGFLLWPRPQRGVVQPSVAKPYLLVRTQPLPRADIVQTVPLAAANQVASSPPVSVISTATVPRLAREIDDAALLSLAAPNPVVLVRLGPHSAELVFARTADADAAEQQTAPQ